MMATDADMMRENYGSVLGGDPVYVNPVTGAVWLLNITTNTFYVLDAGDVSTGISDGDDLENLKSCGSNLADAVKELSDSEGVSETTAWSENGTSALVEVNNVVYEVDSEGMVEHLGHFMWS